MWECDISCLKCVSTAAVWECVVSGLKVFSYRCTVGVCFQLFEVFFFFFFCTAGLWEGAVSGLMCFVTVALWECVLRELKCCLFCVFYR